MPAPASAPLPESVAADLSRVIFARIGWMKFYAGPTKGDDRPLGGGAYNEQSVGHERYNFAPAGGRCYGYFQPAAHSDGPNLLRVSGKDGKTSVNDVLVVFVAGSVIVGWYRNATVHGELHWVKNKKTSAQREQFGFFCECVATDAVLLPSTERTFTVPRGKGGMGRANVRYGRDEGGKVKTRAWMQSAASFIGNYAGPNLVADPMAEAIADAETAIEEAVAVASGQGFLASPAVRKAVEEYAVKRARSYLDASGYEIREKGKPYDLECTKNGETLYVEVKGTQTVGGRVILTPNEVEFARANRQRMGLYLLHSIKVTEGKKGPKASGGVTVWITPWSPIERRLSAVTYWYDVPDGTSGALEAGTDLR